MCPLQWVINGNKMWITNGGVANWYVGTHPHSNIFDTSYAPPLTGTLCWPEQLSLVYLPDRPSLGSLWMLTRRGWLQVLRSGWWDRGHPTRSGSPSRTLWYHKRWGDVRVCVEGRGVRSGCHYPPTLSLSLFNAIYCVLCDKWMCWSLPYLPRLPQNVLGEPGKGFHYAMAAFDRTRPGVTKLMRILLSN